MLIVIGNPDNLQYDPHWKKLIDYCIENGGFIGKKPVALEEHETNLGILKQMEQLTVEGIIIVGDTYF